MLGCGVFDGVGGVLVLCVAIWWIVLVVVMWFGVMCGLLMLIGVWFVCDVCYMV